MKQSSKTAVDFLVKFSLHSPLDVGYAIQPRLVQTSNEKIKLGQFGNEHLDYLSRHRTVYVLL